jgi:hypothetical protein
MQKKGKNKELTKKKHSRKIYNMVSFFFGTYLQMGFHF